MRMNRHFGCSNERSCSVPRSLLIPMACHVKCPHQSVRYSEQSPRMVYVDLYFQSLPGFVLQKHFFQPGPPPPTAASGIIRF